jgi:AcrR family transcriptional regulator
MKGTLTEHEGNVAALGTDAGLRQATIAVLRECGWDGLTLERVAEVAGRSRTTLWRQGVSRESLLAALVGELAEDFRRAMYPVLVSTGSGRDRLTLALDALCDILDRHLPLMLATDEAFHQEPAPGQPPHYLGPFYQFLREGAADGSLSPGDDVERTADVLMNAVLWTYTHLRARHAWSTQRAREAIFTLVLDGVTPRPQRKE